MLNITTIHDIAEQGLSQPYRCQAEDGKEYFVKGLRSSRSSQINEWLCAHMAQAVGLPVAPFNLLEVSDILYEELSGGLKGIGLGCAFGSCAQNDTTWFELQDTDTVQPDLQRRIAAFDWLVRNGDRTMGNPNLLINRSDNTLIVIDHNLAFDTDPTWSLEGFSKSHIFGSAFMEILHDFDHQDKISAFLKPALAAYRQAVASLPDEWQWINIERDIPTRYDFKFAQQTVFRLEHGTLWR